MVAGRAFAKPLPFILGTNGSAVRYGFGVNDLAMAASIGMGYYRNDVPWTVTQGGATPIEGLPGVYSSTNIANALSVVNAVKAAGLQNLLVVTVNQSPGLCPTLSTALTSGTVYTSIAVTTLAFAITSGDSIQLTNGPAGATQTVTAGASMAAGASGSLTVTSFTANANYAAGAWVYDTLWLACTPQHFANTMAYLVAQPGFAGLDWELLNEPDGTSWNVPATLLTQMYRLAYPAMKAADSTCTIHGIVTESMHPHYFVNGTDYYNACVAAGILAGNGAGGRCYDVLSAHCYSQTPSFADYEPPDGYGVSVPLWQEIANWKANMAAKGDTSNIWITEFGWQNASDGPMTTQLQSQYYQNILATLSGFDPINNVPFSSYLKVMCQFAMGAGGAHWALGATRPRRSSLNS